MPAGDPMDSQYSVQTLNRYWCGGENDDDDDGTLDPIELLRQAQTKPKKDKDKKVKKDTKPKKEDKPVEKAPEAEGVEGELRGFLRVTICCIRSESPHGDQG